MVQTLIVVLLQGHSGTGEVQDNHHSLLQRSHGKIRLLLLSFFSYWTVSVSVIQMCSTAVVAINYTISVTSADTSYCK